MVSDWNRWLPPLMSHCNLFWSKNSKVRLQMTHIVANSELLVMIPGIHYIFLSKMLLKVMETLFSLLHA